MTEKKVRVTILTIDRNSENQHDLGMVGGDDSFYYYLPGADYEATRQALRDAGFEERDRINDAIDEGLSEQREGTD